MKCFFGCDIEWKEELQRLNYYRIIDGNQFPFIKIIQQGRCKKCGKIYQRGVNP